MLQEVTSPPGPSEGCFLCRKHRGLEASPPGGYILEDEHWMVCHAPAALGPLGTLFIESRRHFLDHSEMTDEEAATLGARLRLTYAALRSQIHPQRIYQLSTMEGVSHFHAWLVPRPDSAAEKGLKYLVLDMTCEPAAAETLAGLLRQAMSS